MKKLSLSILFLFSFFILAEAAPAQSVGGLLRGVSPSTEPTAVSTDPLGRDTPYGTVFGFLQVAQSGNYKAAADYLQLNAARRQSQGYDLASKLKVLMDRAFVGSLRHISQRPEGSPETGDADTQTVGSFVSGEADVPVVLVRVTDPEVGKIWLFSYQTLTKVPELYDNLQAHQIEDKLPHTLVSRVVLGMPLWQWLALLIAIPISAAIGWGCVLFLAIPRRLWLRYRKQPNLQSYVHVSAPLLLFFGTIAHRVLTSYLGLPLLSRVYYYRASGVLMEIGFFWFLFRATAVAMQRLRVHSIAAGRIGTGTLMAMGERLLKAAIAGVAILVILATVGFNLTTVLAGVGIGGIAIAFAAQKTLENLFGGVSVLADEVMRVGDFCRFGDRVGTVEDISLRSTRVRTLDRSELSIPNGALATMNVENFTRRDKIWFNPTFSVRSDTSPDQLRYLLAEVRRMLYEHPKVETVSARIRLAGFDNNGLSLEVFSYVVTQDFTEFTAIREDLLLRIMETVVKAGTAFAVTNAASQAALDKEKATAAEQEVQRWREQRQLPFPDFASTDKAAFRGSITYPDPESAIGGNS